MQNDNLIKREKYFTYRKCGRVDYHKYLILAMMKAFYQAKILGIDSPVDTYANDGCVISIKWYKGLNIGEKQKLK